MSSSVEDCDFRREANVLSTEVANGMLSLIAAAEMSYPRLSHREVCIVVSDANQGDRKMMPR